MTTIEQALKWWESLDITKKMTLCGNYLTSDDVVNRTDQEINTIYQLEVIDNQKPKTMGELMLEIDRLTYPK